MKIAARYLAPLLAAVAAGAVALARRWRPVRTRWAAAKAVPPGVPKQGHASLHAKPTPRNPNGTLFSNAWLPGYGKGILPR